MEQNTKNLLVSSGLRWNLLFLWALFIGLLWLGEEPDKLNTILVVVIVFFIAVAIVTVAKRMGIIESRVAWMVTFMIMISIWPEGFT